MTRRIRRHPNVSEDILGIATYIAKDNMPVALRFLGATETTLKWILDHPGAGHRRDFDDPRLARVRSWPVKGFRKHLIFYAVEPTGIFILAVMHGARDLPAVLHERYELHPGTPNE